MSKKGENIYQRKDGRWEGRCIQGRNENGTYRYRYIYAYSYQEVKERLIEEKSKIVCPSKTSADMAGNVKEAEGEKKEENFAAVSEELLFCSPAMDWLAVRKHQVKESTYIKYQNIMNNYILPEIGDMTWNNISQETIELFCQKMLSSGGKKQKGLSPKTVSDILSVISSILRYASYHGYRLTFDISAVSIKKETKKMRILSRNEQERLCRFLRSEVNGKNLGLLICLFAGLRLGEICALRWEDVSLSEQTIYVRKTMQRIQNRDNASKMPDKGKPDEISNVEKSVKKTKIIITAPKSSDSVRVIPIPKELVKLLWIYGKGKKGYVLTGRENVYVEPRAMERHFEKTLKKAGMEKVNFHALRHTFATRCVEMDFDVKSLSEILGHSSVSITLNRYVHPSMELKRKNMQRLEELLAVS